MRTKTYKIYKLTNLLNEKPYIGYTHKKIIQRITEHTKAKSYIGDAIRKHEIENFKVEVLHEVKDKNLALLLERMEIWNHKSIVPNGYNQTPGGEGNPNPSEETIEKIKQAALGNQNGQGHHHTEESKEKMRKAKQGKKHTKEHNENIGKSCQGMHRSKESKINMQIGQLKRRIREQEQELINECPWDGT